MNKRIFAKLAGFSLLFIAAALGPRACPAQSSGYGEVSRIFYQANSAYKEGNFEAAITDFELICAMGLAGGNLNYNLGNCYFKKGELGMAVFNYELALFFSPSDSDLRSNYKYAISKLNLGPQLFGNGFQRLAARLFDGETIGFLAILLSAIYIIAVVILICGLFIAKISKMAKILLPALAVLFILSAAALGGKIDNFNKGGVVIAGETEVKFEPLEQGTTYFKLGAGSKVELVEKAQDFCKIKRPDNKVGWVRNTDVAFFSETQNEVKPLER
ncbi:MAG: tetratricopeptide repeat protein [Candidatus Omnitrophota bacterium]|nr:tetratricopeptide repeat protein [Candidatus Omnitrophota bacterium]